jgi:hypothetical protein
MIQLHLGLLPNESLASRYSVVNPSIISCFWVLTDTFARTDQCEVKICRDSSVRKALVREASLFDASKVVVDITKKRRAVS